jgi:hypothetical protein
MGGVMDEGPGGDDLWEPIAGVTLRAYAEINVEFAHELYETAKATSIAAARGISPASWKAAVEGWNRRIRTEPSVAAEFERLYAAVTQPPTCRGG